MGVTLLLACRWLWLYKVDQSLFIEDLVRKKNVDVSIAAVSDKNQLLG